MNSGHYVEGIPVLCQITSLIGYLDSCLGLFVKVNFILTIKREQHITRVTTNCSQM